MSAVVVKHPLVSHYIRTLRDRETDIVHFRQAIKGLGFFLAAEATRMLPTVEETVVTPLGLETPGEKLDSTRVLLVPVLRAGLGFVDSFIDLLPGAKIAHVGISRDHDTLEARTYLSSLPENPGGYDCIFILDPMLATGNSAAKTLEIISQAGFPQEKTVIVCGFAVEAGINQISVKFPAVRVITATIDRGLNDVGYIVPGLGDAGDRLYLL